MKHTSLKIFYGLGCKVSKKYSCPDRLRDMVSDLRLKLAQTEEDISCPAIYRLRAKLRDLMKGEAVEQQISKVVEKSIETLADLSKSCDDLRLENERLLAQVTDLRSALVDLKGKEMPETILQTAETTTVPEYIDISDLLYKLNNCEDAVADLRKQLEQRDEQIDALNKELESMISQKGLEEQIEAMKEELRRKDDKVSHLDGSKLKVNVS